MLFSGKDLQNVLLVDRPKGVKGLLFVCGVGLYMGLLYTIVAGIFVKEKVGRVLRHLGETFRA